ncbi:MAG: hypothetical protein K0R82_2916 [Flavipsychrobacter sp.]|nr:hypothetical protein [Flavipsychrobacter sp.]
MKSLIAWIFIVLSALPTGAQEHFVEVVVTDTILIPADQFIFQVMAMPDDMTMETATTTPIDYSRRERQMRQRQKSMLDSLQAKLMRSGFIPAPLSISDMASGRGYGNQFLTYQLVSEAELRRFQHALRDAGAVNAVLQSAVSTKEIDYQQRLYAKMMDKARANASALAALSGRKLGSILMVSETADENNRWNPYMPTISSRRPGMMSADTPEVNANYALRGKLLVRFGW